MDIYGRELVGYEKVVLQHQATIPNYNIDIYPGPSVIASNTIYGLSSSVIEQSQKYPLRIPTNIITQICTVQCSDSSSLFLHLSSI